MEEKFTGYFEAGELETELWRQLKKRGWTITTVESCTGGAVAARIVNVAGASDILRQAYVTYCDEAKNRLAGVSRETLEKYSAVSRETAGEMALGGAEAAEADVALSVTGLAGPGGGTEDKPVGLVYIGCAIRGQVRVRELHLQGSRGRIREQAAEAALSLALEMLLSQHFH